MNATASPTGVARRYIARGTNVDEALRPCASCATLLCLPDYVRWSAYVAFLGMEKLRMMHMRAGCENGSAKVLHGSGGTGLLRAA